MRELDNNSPTEDVDFVLGTLVRNVAHLAAKCGVPEEKLLALSKVDPACLTDSQTYVPASILERLIHAAVEISQDPLLGLHVSKQSSPESFGVLGYICNACATLREVVDMCIRYEELASDVGKTSLDYEPGVAILSWQLKTQDEDIRHQAEDYILGFWCSTLVRLIPQQKSVLLCAWLQHDAPNKAQQAEYERIFGCPVLFNQSRSALVAPVEALSWPLSHPDADLQSLLEQHASQLLQRDKVDSVEVRARAQLKRLLYQGAPSREELATAMGVSARHLSRQLEGAGTTYHQILDELRLELAFQRLNDTTQSLQDVAQVLSFTESQSFIRWFRRQTGETPNQYRQQRASAKNEK